MLAEGPRGRWPVGQQPVGPGPQVEDHRALAYRSVAGEGLTINGHKHGKFRLAHSHTSDSLTHFKHSLTHLFDIWYVDSFCAEDVLEPIRKDFLKSLLRQKKGEFYFH